jgi:hypothetical protein
MKYNKIIKIRIIELVVLTFELSRCAFAALPPLERSVILSLAARLTENVVARENCTWKAPRGNVPFGLVKLWIFSVLYTWELCFTR